MFGEVKKADTQDSMSKRALWQVMVLFGVSAGLLYAQGGGGTAPTVASFVRESKSSENDLILSMMAQANLTERLTIAKALGQRRDPFIGDVLAGIAASAHGPEGYLAELSLRVLLGGLFEGGVFLDGRVDRARLAPNAREVGRLVRRLQDFGDPLLKAELLGLAIDTVPQSAARVAADEGVFLLGLLGKCGGTLAPERREEAFAYLELVARLKDPVLIEQTVSLIEASRDREFVRRARAVAGG